MILNIDVSEKGLSKNSSYSKCVQAHLRESESRQQILFIIFQNQWKTFASVISNQETHISKLYSPNVRILRQAMS